MGAASRIGSDVALIGGEQFAARCRATPEAFTRRRKMPADIPTKTVIACKGRTLKMEIREFARELDMDEGISAPGYLKAREKLNPEALLYLAQHHAANVYADGDCDDYKGMLLIAVDGSSAAAEAGGDSWEGVEFTYARLASVRTLNEESYRRLKGREPLPVRCVLLDIGGEAPEKIVTNIGAATMSAGELREVYHLRWGVETCFQMLKDRLQMENLTGTKPVLIEQDVYAAAYLLNVAFDMANEADAEARAGTPEGRYKHEMTVNKSLAIGILKDELIRLVLAGDSEREGMMSAIVALLGRNLVPVRRKRSYSREGVNKNRANRYSNTHKRVF